MAEIKVSELPTASNFNDEDYTMIVQNNTSKKIAKENMNMSYKYSTNELVIGKWIDGKPIYRKVITVNNLTPDTDTKTIAHGIINLDKITCLNCIAFGGGDIYFDFNNHPDAHTYIDTTNIYVVVNYSGIIGDVSYAHFILEYTKTTD